MRMLKLSLGLLLISLIVLSCQKDDLSVGNSGSATETRKSFEDVLDCSIDRNVLKIEERRMILLSEFVGMKLQERSFKSNLVTEILDREFKQGISSEIVLSDYFSSFVYSGTTFGNDFQQWIKINYADEQNLITDLCQAFDGIVLDLSWWASEIIKDKEDLEGLSFGSVAAIDPIACGASEIRVLYTSSESVRNVKTPFIDVLPVYVKKSEELVKDPTEDALNGIVRSYSSRYAECDISSDQISAFMTTINCSNVNYFDLTKLGNFLQIHCILLNVEICDDGIDNDGDGFIDDEDQDCWVDVEICNNGLDDDGDGLIDQLDEEDCPCEILCQRDCLFEDNVLVGLKFGDGIFNWICQTLDENHTYLEYNFAIVDICDSQTNGAICDHYDSQDYNTEIQHTTNRFFELKNFTSMEDFNVGENGVVFIEDQGDGWNKYYQAWPIYFDVGGKNMLPGLPLNQWNGDLIGNRIKYNIMELDNSTVSSTETVQSSSNVSHTFDASLSGGFDVWVIEAQAKTSYRYSNAVSNSQTTQLQNRYEKDVQVGGDRFMHYCDYDQFYPDPTGVPNSNWYGVVPATGNFNGAAIYEEIRVKR